MTVQAASCLRNPFSSDPIVQQLSNDSSDSAQSLAEVIREGEEEVAWLQRMKKEVGAKVPMQREDVPVKVSPRNQAIPWMNVSHERSASRMPPNI